MKAAIIILSDPKSGSEEALGRVFNALASAYDFKQQGDEVTVSVFVSLLSSHLTNNNTTSHNSCNSWKARKIGLYWLNSRKPA